MAIANGSSIEAVLTLNATAFNEGLGESLKAVANFKASFSKSITPMAEDVNKLKSSLRLLEDSLRGASEIIGRFNVASKNLSQFNTYAQAVNKLANALKILSSDAVNVDNAMRIIKSAFKDFQNILGTTELKIKGVVTSLSQLNNGGATQGMNNLRNSVKQVEQSFLELSRGVLAFNRIDATSNKVKASLEMMREEIKRAEADLLSLGRGVLAFNRIDATSNKVKSQVEMMNAEFNRSKQFLEQMAWTGVEAFNKIDASSNKHNASLQKVIASDERIKNLKNQLAFNIEKEAMAEEKLSASTDKASNSMNRQATASKGLGKAMSSLRMMGSMVGSMIAYNFVHNLAMATTETINAKSEMNGYFQMLGYTKGQVTDFNKELDKTVQLFPRLNKYSLGETISSIGVEFELTTEEMKKAMPVVSMITSEYLRAGRNVNEASLAVKDILQGEFQRLSRETGVKADQLKEAGWSGDKNDVMGLLEALDKVGKSRNWDTFVTKANSLNDAVLILQNRFGEWSADMVNAVQPAIVGAFNSIMSFAQGLAQSLSGLWKWLSGDSWGAVATKIGMVSSAILLLMPSLVSWRTGASLLEVANMGLSKSLTGLVLGINAETLANNTATESIAMNLLGIKAEQLENTTLVGVINTMIASRTAETVATDVASASNLGFTGGLYAMITGEAIAEGTTISLTGAIGLLTGAFLTSPIGWFTLAILGLASAFYVLTGGLDESWGKMKQFNEVMRNPHDSIKPYKDEIARLNNEISEASEKYGEDSEQVKKLHKELDDAQASLDNATHSVEHGVYWNNEYKKSFEGINAELDKITRKKLGDIGYSDEDIDKVSELSDVMNTGAEKDYHALQVLHKQQSNYGEGVDELSEKLKKMHIEGDEANEILGKFQGNTENLITHSAIANSSEDWWEWMWNSFYAGMDQFWIDWDKFWLDPQWGDGLNGLLRGGIFEGVDVGGWFSKGFDDLGKWFNDGIANLQKDAVNFLKPLDSFGDEVNKFLNDPLGYLHIDLSGFDFFGKLFEGLFNGGDSGATGGFMKKIDIGALLQGLFNLGDSVDFSWAIEWVNTNIISPISQTLMMFVGDPVSFIGNVGFSVSGLLDGLFGTDIFSNIWNWTNTNIIAPIGNAIWSGISQIPIVGDIVALLGLLSNENIGADEKGRAIGNWIGNGITSAIGQIPIIGDIARMLGLIPQEEPDAHSKGKGVGDSIKDGVMNGLNNLGSQVVQEFNDALNGIGQLGQQAFDTAKGWADQLWQGVNSVLQRASPGFFHDQIKLEFGTDIPNAINESGSTAYSVAQSYAQNMYDGMKSVNATGFGLGGAVDEYQDDAQIVADSSYYMGTTTTTAFNDMTLAVNQTTNTMSGNVASTYSGMQQKQQSSLNSMKNQNLQAYNDMYLKSNQSLIQMRDSTSNVTSQMVNAWSHMKNQIVASANQLKSESTSHFNQLSSTIGSFYRKIQNPSNWGAGIPTRSSSARKPVTGRKIATRIASNHGAGINPYQDSKSISLRDLMRMTGVSDATKLDLNTFLASIWGEHGFGWDDWSSSHYSYIKSTSDNWNMKAPMIMGRIQAGNGYKVGEFENGTPHLTWDSFMSTAEAVFNAIPYKFYWDSNWKGDWVSAIKAGACNCSDGSDALIALAQTFGFDGYKQHTVTRGGLGHFYAVINGRKMDTTNFQNHGSWTPLGAGIPTRTANPSGGAYAQGNKTVNVNVEISGTVYGVDDLDSKIQESVKEGLRAEFNDPYTVAI